MSIWIGALDVRFLRISLLCSIFVLTSAVSSSSCAAISWEIRAPPWLEADADVDLPLSLDCDVLAGPEAESLPPGPPGFLTVLPVAAECALAGPSSPALLPLV